MSTFTKWNKLPSELRNHSLSYCYNKELNQYAQLSNLCNDEIQKVNTIAPKYLSVSDLVLKNDGVMINAKYSSNREFCFVFVAASEHTHQFVRYGLEKFENHPILKGNARDCAFKYLEKLLKYTVATNIIELTIDCKHWPTEVLKKIPAISKSTTLYVHVYPSMIGKFINFMNGKTSVKTLTLYDSGSSTSLPPQLFKSNLFKQLDHVKFYVKAMISDDDFLTSNAKFLRLKCDTISEMGINRKIRMWYETQIDYLAFEITRLDGRRYNQEAILHNLPFENGVQSRRFKIQRQDGKKGTVHLHRNNVEFYVTN